MFAHGSTLLRRAPLKFVLDLATVALAVAAALVLFSRIRNASSPEAETGPRFPRTVANWSDYSQEGVRLGPDSALVTVVEFGDFQCPICARAAAYLSRFRGGSPSEVAIVYRHYPLHQPAFTAAIAAECARLVGSFERFHDALYRQPRLIGEVPWSAFAHEAGVADTLAFAQCMRGNEAAVAVSRDTAAANALGVRGTPTFLVNEVVVPGFPGDEIMDSMVFS